MDIKLLFTAVEFLETSRCHHRLHINFNIEANFKDYLPNTDVNRRAGPTPVPGFATHTIPILIRKLICEHLRYMT